MVIKNLTIIFFFCLFPLLWLNQELLKVLRLKSWVLMMKAGEPNINMKK